MTNCKHQCYKCEHFNKYYINDGIMYQKTNFGYCRANQKNVAVHGSCGKYAFARPSGCRSELLIAARLNALLTEISILRELIEEEARDKNL